ncbi:MAG: type II toxin-antitoxin system VapC family toxin [Actinomycetota bacterium]|nr:type II toxin-antitoxin system VapC family toxin [Actinomycetota bacterium]
MRLLLDTHALIWWLEDSTELAGAARDAIGDGDNEVAVSAASAWEMAIKEAAGKLRVPPTLGDAVKTSGFTELPITIEHALKAGVLDPHHRDPFDRMLVAQALVEGYTIVTRDPRFEPYGVAVLTA